MTTFVTVEGSTLARAMRAILATVKRYNTIPILECARLVLRDSTLTIDGTDLDIQITSTIDVIDANGEFTICLDAKTLSRLARAAGPMPVRIEPDAARPMARVVLGNDDASYELPTLPAGDFPDIAGLLDQQLETFAEGQLSANLRKVRRSISTEETRYYLNGVYWHATSEGRFFVSTDGHRLSRCRYDAASGDIAGHIIPRKVVDILVNHLAGREVRIFGAKNVTKLDFKSDGLAIRVKTIDGTFPEYRRIMPPAPKFSFSIGCTEMVEAIRRATAVSFERGRALKFFNHHGRVAVGCKNSDVGAATIHCSAEWPEFSDSFGLNAEYLRQMMEDCGGDLTFSIINSGSPISIADADPTMTRVIMPMRV